MADMADVTEIKCVFCGEWVDLEKNEHAMQVQVVYGGLVERTMPDGSKYKVVRKNPGKAIAWHNICGLPEEPEQG